VIAETDLVPLSLHARDDVADAAPGVQPAVQEAKLGLAGVEEREAEGGGKESAAWEALNKTQQTG